MAIKTSLGALRYNNRMQRIWDNAMRIEAERIANGEQPNPNLTDCAQKMKRFTIRNTRFAIRDYIRIAWSNTSPQIVDEGVITAYEPKRGRCCLQVDNGAWINPRHRAAIVTKPGEKGK